MITQKPTIRTNNAAQMRAIQQGADYVIAPVLGHPGVWSVRKQGQVQPYRVDLNAATCSCPCRQPVCKHLEMVRIKTALLQNRPAPAPVMDTWSTKSREERNRLFSNGDY